MKRIYKEKDIPILARLLLNDIEIKHKKQATVLSFVGNLGAGKTTFVKAMASDLGIKEDIISPTFVISKEYKIKKHKIFKKLIHIDAYRLKNKTDLNNIGFFEQIDDPTNLIIVE